MKIAQKADDLGVIITYNTEAAYVDSSPVRLDGSVAVNPVIWTTDSTYGDRSNNIRAEFYDGPDFVDSVSHFCGAYVDLSKGSLIVDDMQPLHTDKIDLNTFNTFPDGVYHRYDYSFFYDNLKDNVQRRIDAYFKQ